MATIQKELIGKIDLVGGNDYFFSVPTVTGSALPNALDNQIIEEVYINCDMSLGSINIYLPSIASFNSAWNTKIYVFNKNVGAVPLGASVVIYPYNNEIIVDTLNGTSASGVVVNQTNYLHIVSDNMWMNLICPAPSLGPIL